METTRAMTRSPVGLARKAVELAQRALPAYSSPFSRKDYTQHQLFALMVLATWLKLDHRAIVAVVEDWSDIREALGLTSVPHWSTLYKAQQRLLKKVGLGSYSTRSLPTLGSKEWLALKKKLALTRPGWKRATAQHIMPTEQGKNVIGCGFGPS